MMHTVEQAKSLWCPLVRHGSADAPTFSRGFRNNNPTNKDSTGERPIDEQEYGRHCIGDACAMWRWGEFKTVSRDEVVTDPSLGPGGKRVIQVASSVPAAGYCGLAGKPGVAP